MSELCEQVHAFADGELAGEAKEVFLVHLASCPVCQGELSDVLQLSGAGDALGVPREPPGELFLPSFDAPEENVIPLRIRARRIAAAVLPLAAAVLLAIWLPGRSVELPAYTMTGPSGAVEYVRGSTTAGRDRPAVFIPDSIVSIKLFPAEPVTGATPVAGVFVLEPDGSLVRAPVMDIRSTQQGAFAIRANARAMFGANPGTKRIHVVIAPSEGVLDRLHPKSPESLTGDRSLRVISTSIEYRLED